MGGVKSSNSHSIRRYICIFNKRVLCQIKQKNFCRIKYCFASLTTTPSLLDFDIFFWLLRTPLVNRAESRESNIHGAITQGVVSAFETQRTVVLYQLRIIHCIIKLCNSKFVLFTKYNHTNCRPRFSFVTSLVILRRSPHTSWSHKTSTVRAL